MTTPPGTSLVRASLTIHEPPTGLAMTLGGEIGTVDFQFNPKELTLVREATWHQEQAVGIRHGCGEFVALRGTADDL